MVSCGTVEVLPVFDSGRVQITDCSISTDQVVAGRGSVTATATISNDNNDQATVDVQFESGGTSTVDNIDVGGGSTAEASAVFEYPDSGSYPVEVMISGAARAPDGGFGGL